ncbi:hypothetical protein AbD4_02809 [Acinetobacter baumannii]|nr:hypothetical protein AbD4_02809 [Acinetobacter baumannii]
MRRDIAHLMLHNTPMPLTFPLKFLIDRNVIIKYSINVVAARYKYTTPRLRYDKHCDNRKRIVNTLPLGAEYNINYNPAYLYHLLSSLNLWNCQLWIIFFYLMKKS